MGASACAVFDGLQNPEHGATKYCQIKTEEYEIKSNNENEIRVSAVRGALLSANANNGANAGFGYLNANNRSSWTNANGGFRFYRGFNFQKDISRLLTADTSPLGEKIVIKTV